jgi:hypothetical protein
VLDLYNIPISVPEVPIPNLKEYSACLKLPRGVDGAEMY